MTRLYAPDSFWNVPIPASPPIDPNSAAMVQASLVAYKANANFANTQAWGVPIVYSRNTDPLYEVGCTRYDCGNDIKFHIPLGAKPTTGSDHHLVVVNLDTMEELDMWIATFDGSHWSAGSRYVTRADGWGAMAKYPAKANGAVASGFAGFGGIPTPEEFASGLIPHALTITTPRTRAGFIACPATHTDGKVDALDALPEGARVQLDPTFVIPSGWPAWKKTMAKALQVYGAYCSDTGGTLAIRGEADVNRPGAWGSIPVGANISDLGWEHMRVLDVSKCPEAGSAPPVPAPAPAPSPTPPPPPAPTPSPPTPTPPPSTLPAPTHFTGRHTLRLSWNSVAGAAYYILRKNGTEYARPTSNSAYDQTPVEGTVYHVCAVDQHDHRSAWTRLTT